MKDLQKRIERILRENEYARGSDNILMVEVIKDYGFSPDMGLLELSERIIKCELPSLESISRVRRKVQELHEELKPSTKIRGFRADREEQFREYAKGRY